MSLSRLTSLSIIAVFALACDSAGIPGPPVGLGFSAASAACGPTDGPAVAIYLASAPVQSLEPAPPYVRVYIWQPVESVTGSWNVEGSRGEGGAWRHLANGDIEFASNGRVTVNGVSADSTIEGWANIIFPSGQVWSGFRAEWHPRAMLCG